ncbi:MAG: aminotransferase class I/II-fold pyridoxal phosphate-dependent enzyme [Verrucomicrobia bacterium]|nr:aminotransferase class I/II-fold pyridoxal phosphate-dependent enzyme [Verrucomicrobiota bacterium]NBU08575.1 aminotransferase class I/II-fold pyridoxal phosphate-dependent enzyme [Pseudomonadota bacterium]NDA65474.1 aminotransferase class I/II-fold pyridoxal phosphate-dependent enzyme [Verrucomicrobiota bacterium]NDB74747.1 aminotransferase class I/II-fold pyridoxal phosphate-dependent enzyme [Verrucomicrobiota bacterium]NDD37340.1 aminotransferase class I/II-fold pyridoxal phosphate-depend
MAVRAQRPLIRPLVQRLHAYVPGEQPKIPGLIKLNTNENPYPPSPKVLAAVKAAVDGRLRLYPNPTASGLREKLAQLHRCAPENIIVGNGSDELLALATRTFVEPVAAFVSTRDESTKSAALSRALPPSEGKVQYFNPSYSLYPVLAEIAGAVTNAVPLNADFTLPALSSLAKRGWDFKAALSLITTPNAPSGRGFSTAELDALCAKSKGVVVLDEAYVDFAREQAMALALKHSHVLVSRTFSKAYSLCFQRVGYFVGHADLIAALDKVRDSYNVNGLGQIAALATLADLPYYRRNFRRIITTREQVTRELTGMGWTVLPSQTNFLLARPTRFSAEDWLAKLRAKKLLVRWFKYPEVRDYLRITIGSEAEMEVFVKTVRAIAAGS